MFDRLLAAVRRAVPQPESVTGAVQSRAVVARIGALLGPAFAICFITGLISHNAQSPDGIGLRPWPSGGYRISQGIHVATGIACLPLLMAKVFAAYPRILDRPDRHGPNDRRWLIRFVAERGLTGILTVAGIVEVSTGLFNIFQWYAFRFAFVPVHYAVGWVAIGAIMIHVAVKLPAIRVAFHRPVGPRHGPALEPAEQLTSDSTRSRTRIGIASDRPDADF